MRAGWCTCPQVVPGVRAGWRTCPQVAPGVRAGWRTCPQAAGCGLLMGLWRRVRRTKSDERRPAAGGAASEHRGRDERPWVQAASTGLADRTGSGERLIITLAGVREPIVVILFLIAFFTAISGKPLDGLLLLIVATGLAWDAAARYRRAARQDRHNGGRQDRGGPGGGGRDGGGPGGGGRDGGGPGGGGQDGGGQDGGAETGGAGATEAVVSYCTAASAVTAAAGAAGSAPADPAAVPGSLPDAGRARQPAKEALAAGRRRWLLVLAAAVGAAVYAVVVGGFSRYSWPATVGVIGLGAVVVAAGWRGPLRRRPDPGRLPLPGAALWAALLVAGGLWELASLLQQPDLTTTSYAHPTISALTDPLLGSHTGRSVALAAWLAIGWYLADR